MLQIQNLHLDYPRQGQPPLRALRNLSLSLEPGERCALVGPSGCGKSSLLALIAGLLPPTEGTISVSGTAVTGPRPEVALVLQDHGLFPWKTVYDNAVLGLTLKGSSPDEIRATALPLLEDLGLAEKLSDYPQQLSGGQRQRVAIARALLAEPRLLLMDEPFAALDLPTQSRLEELVLDLCRQRDLSLLIATHNIEEAVFLAHRVLVFGPEPGVPAALLDIPADLDRNAPEFFAQCARIRQLLGGGSHD